MGCMRGFAEMSALCCISTGMRVVQDERAQRCIGVGRDIKQGKRMRAAKFRDGWDHWEIIITNVRHTESNDDGGIKMIYD